MKPRRDLRKFLFGPALFLSFFSHPALAGRGGPCAEDARKHCEGKSVAGGQLQECLKQNIGQLSEACKAQIGGVKTMASSAASSAKDSCAKEIQTLCKGMSPLGGALQKCMKENANKLPEGCRGNLSGLKGSLIPK